MVVPAAGIEVGCVPLLLRDEGGVAAEPENGGEGARIPGGAPNFNRRSGPLGGGDRWIEVKNAPLLPM